MEYIIYTDESDKRGIRYSNFYGGALVRSHDLEEVIDALHVCSLANNLNNEIKWQRVTEQYLDKYIDVMKIFFDLIEKDKIKIRIMFTHNFRIAEGLTKRQKEDEFHILYYEFIKHAFGLAYSNSESAPVSVRLNLDLLPDTKEKNEQFKSFILALNKSPEFKRARIAFHADQIAEVDSKKHLIMQALDVVLGSMAFRLNDKHLIKPEGSTRRGKRTIAKEKLYKYINQRIRNIYSNFNIGESTGRQNGVQSLWEDPYRHWKFTSSQTRIDPTQTRSAQKK